MKENYSDPENASQAFEIKKKIQGSPAFEIKKKTQGSLIRY